MIIYDLETTGTRYQYIVEIAAWNVVSDATFHRLVNPMEANHPLYGTGIHHLTDEELLFEETWTEVGRQFLLWMEQERFKTYLLLSHGCSDQVALKRDFIRSELHIPENWIFCNAQNRIYCGASRMCAKCII